MQNTRPDPNSVPTGLAPKAVIGAVMRKLTNLIYGVITSGKPFDANHEQTCLAIQDGI